MVWESDGAGVTVALDVLVLGVHLHAALGHLLTYTW
jgi:hypothetical protein